MRAAVVIAFAALASSCTSPDAPFDPTPKPVYVMTLLTDSTQVGVAGALGAPMVVAVVDSFGQPAVGVQVRFTTDAILQGLPTVLTDAAGHATGGWKFDWQPFEYTLTAQVLATGQQRRVRAQVAANPASKVLKVLGEEVLGDARVVIVQGGSPRNALLVGSRHHFAPDLAPAAGDWVMAFGRGRAPVVAPLEFTDDPDTLTLTLRDPLQVDITIWVFEFFGGNRAAAEREVNRTSLFWSAARWGLRMGDVQYKDATDYSGPAIQCGALPGFADPDRINVYLTEAWPAPMAYGVRCTPTQIIMKPSEMNDSRRVLAHEIGHSFGLVHDASTSNFMHPLSLGGAGNIGQIHFAHFSDASVLNAIFHHRTAAEMASCCLVQAFP
jgi:hypothetical protein